MIASRGLDPKDFKIVAFGGAGPMHAAYVAKELGIKNVIIPNNPGVFSASGLFCSNLTMDFVRTVKGAEPNKIGSFVEEIKRKADQWFKEEKIENKDQKRLWSLDIRYNGQNYEINIPVEKKFLENSSGLKKIEEIFHKKHFETYGHVHKNKTIEIVNLRLRCVGLVSVRLKQKGLVRSYNNASRDTVTDIQARNVFFPDKKKMIKTIIYKKISILPDTQIIGPAIIEEMDSTIVIPPGSSATINNKGDVFIKLKK
jgi:N-methylhydantoinase A